MKTSDFVFELPEELIAQEPLPQRDQSRMMVVHRDRGAFEHRQVTDLPEYLQAGDLLVVNETQVFPARVFGKRTDTGGRVELLLLEEAPEPGGGPAEPAGVSMVWQSLYRASRRAKAGMTLALAGGRMRGEVLEVDEMGRVRVRLSADEPVMDVLETEGFAPVPPYIRRKADRNEKTVMDRQRYQTVYARNRGAVAAPTAGLHFSTALLDRLAAAGVGRAAITLHVGPGTFKPVKVAEVSEHRMESERYRVGPEAAAAVNRTHQAGKRVVAVGTTTVRTLETVAAERNGGLAAGEGRTSVFIYPPYRFRVVDALVTNFHLPASSLLMMVSAFATLPGAANPDSGRLLVMKAYREAVQAKYRFYSYGDCMLIL